MTLARAYRGRVRAILPSGVCSLSVSVTAYRPDSLMQLHSRLELSLGYYDHGSDCESEKSAGCRGPSAFEWSGDGPLSGVAMVLLKRWDTDLHLQPGAGADNCQVDDFSWLRFT